MKTIITRIGMALVLAAGMGPSMAVANPPTIIHNVDLGNGYCGTVSCGQYGCAVIDTYPCPREMGDG